MRTALPLIMSMLALAGCSGSQDFRECAPPDAARLALVPDRLSGTGLFSDLATEALGPGIFPYAPRFELWSDGAVKRRWIRLPPGSQIDTEQMDDWRFPEGTQLWKEFTRDGVRVETRLLQKVGPAPDDWVAVAYLWDDTGSDAYAVPEGIINAHGTTHDVPTAADCMGCHGGRRSRVLGFSAIQLSHAGPPGGLDLQELTRRGLLSAPPPGDFEVPGDENTRAALGYLHANCSHCHNPDEARAEGPRCFEPRGPFDFSLRVGELGSVERTATYRTAIGKVVRRGSPMHSELFLRVRERDPDVPTMPPLGTEVVDADGVALLRAWIEQL
jgi:hypothetical protein